MSKRRTRIAKVQKEVDPLRPLEQELARLKQPVSMQPVALRTAYQRAQANHDGLTPANLLALQRTLGNRQVQRMLAQRVDSANSPQPHALILGNPMLKVQTKLTLGASTNIYKQKDEHTTAQEGSKATPPTVAERFESLKKRVSKNCIVCSPPFLNTYLKSYMTWL